MKERRLMKVAITNELLIMTMTQDNFISAVRTTKGIPSDAVFMYSYTDNAVCQSYFVFEHPSFADVELWSEIPTLQIEHIRYHGRAAAAEMVLEGLP